MDNSVASKMSRASSFGTAPSLYASGGRRKYLNEAERREAFACAGDLESGKALFIQTLAWTGARVSEVLAICPASFQLERGLVSLVTLKRRKLLVREVPLPSNLLTKLDRRFGLRSMQSEPLESRSRLWPWHRVTAWRLVKSVMEEAGLAGPAACPRGFRHGFGVAALQAGVPITLLQRWLGHAKLTTTAIYTQVSGPEELAMAAKLWNSQL